jgi:hypothetical protein
MHFTLLTFAMITNAQCHSLWWLLPVSLDWKGLKGIAVTMLNKSHVAKIAFVIYKI